MFCVERCVCAFTVAASCWGPSRSLFCRPPSSRHCLGSGALAGLFIAPAPLSVCVCVCVCLWSLFLLSSLTSLVRSLVFVSTFSSLSPFSFFLSPCSL